MFQLCLTSESVHTMGKCLLGIIHMLSEKAGFLLGDKQNIFSFEVCKKILIRADVAFSETC